MSELDNNLRKRENFTANIIFSVLFGIGSFIFYKQTGKPMWALFLFVACVLLLFCYSSILSLEEESIELNEALASEEEEEEVEEEFEDEGMSDEERRFLFEKNVVAFKKEAKAKYDEMAKQLGKPTECLSDDKIDIWLIDGRIISMLKWNLIEEDIDDYEGEYADMIIDGMSGRNIDFEYGLERYKNMPKYGSLSMEHNFTKEEEVSEVSSDYEEEYVDLETPVVADDDSKDANLIAQIFEKLIS